MLITWQFVRAVDIAGVQCSISLRKFSTKVSHDLTYPRIGLFRPASSDVEATREANISGDCRQLHAAGEPPPLQVLLPSRQRVGLYSKSEGPLVDNKLNI